MAFDPKGFCKRTFYNYNRGITYFYSIQSLKLSADFSPIFYHMYKNYYTNVV